MRTTVDNANGLNRAIRRNCYVERHIPFLAAPAGRTRIDWPYVPARTRDGGHARRSGTLAGRGGFCVRLLINFLRTTTEALHGNQEGRDFDDRTPRLWRGDLLRNAAGRGNGRYVRRGRRVRRGGFAAACIIVGTRLAGGRSAFACHDGYADAAWRRLFVGSRIAARAERKRKKDSRKRMQRKRTGKGDGESQRHSSSTRSANEVQSTGSASQKRLFSFDQLPSGF